MLGQPRLQPPSDYTVSCSCPECHMHACWSDRTRKWLAIATPEDCSHGSPTAPFQNSKRPSPADRKSGFWIQPADWSLETTILDHKSFGEERAFPWLTRGHFDPLRRLPFCGDHASQLGGSGQCRTTIFRCLSEMGCYSIVRVSTATEFGCIVLTKCPHFCFYCASHDTPPS